MITVMVACGSKLKFGGLYLCFIMTRRSCFIQVVYLNNLDIDSEQEAYDFLLKADYRESCGH